MLDAALKLSDNIEGDDAQDVFLNKTPADDSISNPLVYAAAHSLIAHKRKYNADVKIEAFDVPHDALAQISEQLDELGTTGTLKTALLDALKDYVMSKGGVFSRAANAKPVYIALQVADKKPDFQFENGVTEMAAIDGTHAQVEGASSVNVRLTATGTSMTSNAADVDKMFANAKGVKLWIQFEAPTAEELDGFLSEQQLALVAVGEAIGGAVSAEELKDVLEQLQEDGLITPEIVELLENMIELRTLAEAGITPEGEARIAELNENISQLIEAGIESGAIPTSLAKGVIQSLGAVAETYGLENVISPESLNALDAKVKVTELSDKLEGLKAELDPEIDADAIAEIDAMIEKLDGLEGRDLVDVLNDIPDQLSDMKLPENAADAIAEISQMADTISTDVEAALPPVDPTLVLASLAADDIAALIQELDGAENLPPELQTLLEALQDAGIDLQNMSPESIVEALSNQGDPAVAQIMQDLVVTLNTPDVQAALPQETLNTVNVILRDNAQLVEAVTVQHVVSNLNEIVANANLSADQIEVIQDTISKLENGEGLDVVSADVTEAIKADATIQEMSALLESDSLSPEQAQVVEQALADLKDGNSTSEAVAEVHEIAQVQNTIEALTSAIESGDMTAQQAEAAKEAVTKLENGETIQSIDQAVLDVVGDTLDASSLTTSAVDAVDNITKSIEGSKAENVVLANETIEAIGEMANDIGAVQNALHSIENPTPEQIEAIQKIETVLETLKTDPANIEALAELSGLDMAEVAKSLPADVRADIQNTLDVVTNSAGEITAIQQTAIAIKHDVSTSDIQNVSQVVNALNANADTLAAQGVDIDGIKQTLNDGITSADALGEIAKVTDTLSAVAPEQAAVIAQVIETQITAVAEKAGVEPASVEQAVDVVKAISSQITTSDPVKTLLAESGVDVDNIIHNLGEPQGVAQAATLIEVVNASPELRDALPPQTLENIEAVLHANADSVATKMSADAPSVDQAIIKDAIIQSAEIAATLSTDSDMKQIIESAGIDSASVEKIVADLQSGDGVAVLQAIETLQNSGADIQNAIEGKGISLNEISQTQIAVQAERLDIEPQTLKEIVSATAALSKPEVQSALKDAGINPDTAILQVIKNPTSTEAQNVIAQIKDAAPAEAKAAVAQIEAQVTKAVTAKIDAQPITSDAPFKVDAVSQQLSSIAKSVEKSVVQAGDSATNAATMVEKLNAADAIVQRLGTDTPPTVGEIKQAAATLKETSQKITDPAVSGQVAAIQSQLTNLVENNALAQANEAKDLEKPTADKCVDCVGGSKGCCDAFGKAATQVAAQDAVDKFIVNMPEGTLDFIDDFKVSDPADFANTNDVPDADKVEDPAADKCADCVGGSKGCCDAFGKAATQIAAQDAVDKFVANISETAQDFSDDFVVTDANLHVVPDSHDIRDSMPDDTNDVENPAVDKCADCVGGSKGCCDAFGKVATQIAAQNAVDKFVASTQTNGEDFSDDFKVDSGNVVSLDERKDAQQKAVATRQFAIR